MDRIVVIVAHPQLEHSRVNRALMDAAARCRAAGRVEVRDLYALYPDHWIDVDAERAVLAEARLLVWQHPLHWYGLTPLLKLWLDDVFGFGWAYGPGGRALVGKDLWWVTSTGGSEAAYRPEGHNRHFFDAFVPPVEQTAALVGMRLLPPFVLHGAHRLSPAEVDAHAATYAERLSTYPDWPELAELPACEPPSLAVTDRPA